jgi:hypothetical protein
LKLYTRQNKITLNQDGPCDQLKRERERDHCVWYLIIFSSPKTSILKVEMIIWLICNYRLEEPSITSIRWLDNTPCVLVCMISRGIIPVVSYRHQIHLYLYNWYICNTYSAILLSCCLQWVVRSPCVYQRWETTNLNHAITWGLYSSQRTTNLCIISVWHVMSWKLRPIAFCVWYKIIPYGILEHIFSPMQLYRTVILHLWKNQPSTLKVNLRN